MFKTFFIKFSPILVCLQRKSNFCGSNAQSEKGDLDLRIYGDELYAPLLERRGEWLQNQYLHVRATSQTSE